jgi:hypothetical protein
LARAEIAGLRRVGGRSRGTEKFEAGRRRPRLKVLFTTGYSRNAIVHHGRLDPGVHMIPKPFSLDDLGAKVRALLDGGPE